MWQILRHGDSGKISKKSVNIDIASFLSYHFASRSVNNISNSDPTLAEIAAEFLVSLPQEDRETAQEKVYKFIRWLGLHRKVNELSPLDIASYAEQITSSETKPVKSFLSYIRHRGLCEANLAVHLRVKKTSHKTVAASQQNSEVRATLSTQGYAKLEAELANLKSQRCNITQELRRAAADKDFRENAPLQAAREHKSHLEGRIQELESTLKSAAVIGEGHDTARIKIGDTVMLYDPLSGKQLHYTLVDPREANPSQGMISIASPVGKTLLDKERGQTIKVTAPAGVFAYRVEDIQHKITC